MQRQTRQCESPAHGLDSMPNLTAPKAAATMGAGTDHSVTSTPTNAAALSAFEFVMRAPGDLPIAAGGLFASDVSHVPNLAHEIVRSVQTVLSRILGVDPRSSFDDCHIETQFRPLPLLNPRPFALDHERMIYATELIAAGPRFFPTSRQTLFGRATSGRRPFLDRVSTTVIAQLLTTDPGVRRARAAGEEVSWRLSADYSPEDNGSVRVALHVTASENAVPISPATAIGSLSLALCMVSYDNSGEGREWEDTLASAPSATVRAATAASQLTVDEHYLAQCADVVAFLDALDLPDLATKLAGQAIEAVAPRET